MRFVASFVIAGALAAGACVQEAHPIVFLAPPAPSPLMGSTLYPDVPAARAGTSPARWEYMCTNKEAVPAAGAEGWDLVTVGPGSAVGAATVEELGMWFCFRRELPAMATTDAPAAPPSSCVHYEERGAEAAQKCFDTERECRDFAHGLRVRDDLYHDVSDCAPER